MCAQAKPGFSLIEIIIAIAIVALMAAASLKVYNYLRKAEKGSSKIILQTVQTAIQEFRNDTGAYPTSLDDLITRPAGEVGKRWQGDYLPQDEIPVDGYKQALQYQLNPKGSKHPYELYSWGPNREGSPEEEWISVWNK